MKSIGEKIDINDVSIINKSDFLNIIRDEFKMIISDGGVLLIVVFAMLIYTTHLPTVAKLSSEYLSPLLITTIAHQAGL